MIVETESNRQYEGSRRVLVTLATGFERGALQVPGITVSSQWCLKHVGAPSQCLLDYAEVDDVVAFVNEAFVLQLRGHSTSTVQ
jgi:hypothetical protein